MSQGLAVTDSQTFQRLTEHYRRPITSASSGYSGFLGTGQGGYSHNEIYLIPSSICLLNYF